jgi:ATP-dependent RNA helicase DDX51/DBP6
MLIAPTSLKPLLLFHLIHTKSITNALIFTKSTESTNRLVMLFEFFETARVGSGGQSGGVIAKAYSSDLNPSDRKSILQKFKSAEIGL